MAEILASADKLAGDISANIAKLREEVRELENKKELILKDQA